MSERRVASCYIRGLARCLSCFPLLAVYEQHYGERDELGHWLFQVVFAVQWHILSDRWLSFARGWENFPIGKMFPSCGAGGYV